MLWLLFGNIVILSLLFTKIVRSVLSKMQRFYRVGFCVCHFVTLPKYVLHEGLIDFNSWCYITPRCDVI